MANLVRNYHPHLDVETEPEMIELRDALMATARDMLRKYLHKTRNLWRFIRQGAGGADSYRVWSDTRIALIPLADFYISFEAR